VNIALFQRNIQVLIEVEAGIPILYKKMNVGIKKILVIVKRL